MATLDYFEVESTEPVGGEHYKKLASVVIADHNLLKVLSKLHISIDPKIPLFVAVGITRRLLHDVTVRDFTDVNIQDRVVTISIGDETYLAPLLQALWDKFGKERVQQPDRFTIVMALEPDESAGLADMVVIDPSESLYKDLIYSMQIICPEGFKVRRQSFSEGMFYFVASEDTLDDDILPVVREKFALMGESI